MATPDVHIAKNGRYYVRLPGGQTQFISDAEAKKLLGSSGPKKTVRRAPAEKPTRRASVTSARVSVRGQAEIDFNERQVGTILRGFIEAARGKTDDPARLFGEVAETPRADAMLLELGREVYGHMPAALAYFDVTADEWSGWYKRDTKAKTSLTQMAQPFSLAPTAWLPPVIGAITSRFGAPRDGARHEGVDIAVPVGTPVVAPVDLKIKEVSFGQKAGRYIVADAIRDDGSFDDDGYRLTFAHLSDVRVSEGQIVQRGQPIGLSGATGQATGPHLHFKVEWVDDGVFRDSRVAVDPLGLVPEAVVTGQLAPQPITGGSVPALTSDNKPLNVIVAPGAGRVSIGHGIIQPDTDVRVGSPDVQLQRFDQRSQDADDDPLSGIVTAARGVIDAVASPDVLRTLGGLASAGASVVGALQPETLPITGPIAAGGAVVAANAKPLSDAIQEVAQSDQRGNPLEGIV